MFTQKLKLLDSEPKIYRLSILSYFCDEKIKGIKKKRAIQVKGIDENKIHVHCKRAILSLHSH